MQFVWRIPDGDFLRAIFSVTVLKVDNVSDKYVIQLDEFVAARQESEDGQSRSKEELDLFQWRRVHELAGKKVSLAFEVDDGRPLWLRYETLTGEHDFFHRLSELPPGIQKRIFGRESQE